MIIKYSLIDNYLIAISNIFLILLFPGFILYNTVIAYGIMSPIFEGFFKLFSIIYLFLMLPVFLRWRLFLDKKIVNYFLIYFVFNLYIFFVSTVNYILDSRIEIYQAYIQVIEVLVLMFVMFLIGFFISLNKKMYSTFKFCFLITVALLLLYVLVTGQVMFYAKSFSSDSTADYVSTYQGYARSTIVMSFILLGFTKNIGRYFVLYLTAIFVLFILGSRSDLSGFIFAGGVLIPLRFKLNLFKTVQSSFFLILGVVFIYLSYEKFSSNRSFQLLNISEASSWIARENLAEIAFMHIKENPIFGYFAGHVIDGGSVGAYTHNILSVWAGFGVIAFILYSLLSFIPLFNLYFMILSDNKRTDKFYFCFLFSLFVGLLIIFSNSFFWFMPGLIWGMYLSVKKESLG